MQLSIRQKKICPYFPELIKIDGKKTDNLYFTCLLENNYLFLRGKCIGSNWNDVCFCLKAIEHRRNQPKYHNACNEIV